MPVEYEALAIGIFLVAAILFWKKVRAVEKRLGKVQREINVLRVQESRRFVIELNSRVETSKIEPKGGSDEVDRGEIVKLRKQSLATTPNPA